MPLPSLTNRAQNYRGITSDTGRTRAIVRGWSDVADDLVLQNHVELALAVRDFAKRLPLVKTEREWIRDRILEQVLSAARKPLKLAGLKTVCSRETAGDQRVVMRVRPRRDLWLCSSSLQ